jgi:hypothetical protein
VFIPNILASDFANFTSKVREKLSYYLESSDIVDYDSAEFNISYNNQLELDNVEISSDTISEMVAFEIKEYLTEFFTPNELADAIAE